MGTSGGQKTTREAPTTIFAPKMGGPGTQMGGPGIQKESKIEPKFDKNRHKNLVDFWNDFWKDFCPVWETFVLPKWSFFGDILVPKPILYKKS